MENQVINTKPKKQLHQEWVFILATILMAFSVVLSSRSSFGVSMVVAPAYTIHYKLYNDLGLTFFTFGRAEYIFQFFVILVLALVTLRMRWKWFLSFLTAVFYGTFVDIFNYLFDVIFEAIAKTDFDSYIASCPTFDFFGHAQPYSVLQVVLLACGLVITSFGVASLFKTYLPLQVYELFVREFANLRGCKMSRVKFIYDYSSLAVALILVFVLFGRFNSECVGIGTIAAVIVNAPLINMFSKLLDKKCDFPVYPKIRKWFD